MRRPILLSGAIVAAICLVLFRQSFNPSMALFANDGPLALMMSDVYKVNVFTGVWNNLNFFGFDAGTFMPDISSLVFVTIGPLLNNQWYPAISLVFMAVSVATLCRTLGLRPVACITAGVAAGLNSDFLSYACWGLPTLPMCVGWSAFAMASIKHTWPRWVAYTVAGGCIAQSIMEGYDNGAIMSLYVAAFAFVHENGRRRWISVPWIAVTSAVVGAFALQSLVSANISGISQVKQDPKEQWAWVTQWSFPPDEASRIVIPGLYGYRMDSPRGQQYVGRVGSHQSWDAYFDGKGDPSQQMLRFSGAGPYAGVGVVLLALLAVALTPRRAAFLAVAGAVSLLLAFGRFTWCYELFYNLPYASAIRIPAKFLHPMSLCLCVLAGIGVEAMWSIEKPLKIKASVVGVLALFTILCGFSFATPDVLSKQLAIGLIDMPAFKSVSENIRVEYMAFTLFAMCFVLLFARILAGGMNSKVAAWSIIGLVAIDLWRAATPWVVYYDHISRLGSTPLFSFLAKETPMGRVCGTIPLRASGDWGNAQQHLEAVYRGEWMEHQFRRWNVLTREFVQMPRMPDDLTQWLQSVARDPIKDWTESGVRWLITIAPMEAEMNRMAGAAKFKTKLRFGLDGIKPVIHDTGPFALSELLDGGRFVGITNLNTSAQRPRRIELYFQQGPTEITIRDRLTDGWSITDWGSPIKQHLTTARAEIELATDTNHYIVAQFNPPLKLWWWSTICVIAVGVVAVMNRKKT